jgi:eukaryotic-like serine/threonine-protein kinase
VLGDDAQEIIKTVHGFRLTLPVTKVVHTPSASTQASAVSIGMILRDRPLWQLTRALSTSKRTTIYLATRQVDGEQRVFKLAHDGAGLRTLKRELSVTRVLQSAQSAEGICQGRSQPRSATPKSAG